MCALPIYLTVKSFDLFPTCFKWVTWTRSR